MLNLRKLALPIIVFLACCISLSLAAQSPLLQWREPVYIIAGFAGIISLIFLLVQPLLILNILVPRFSAIQSRRFHRFVGAGIFLAVVIHVGGLWITSPPDVMDALLFASPTPFSLWGVLAMWAVFATALITAFRKRLAVSPRLWKFSHKAMAFVIIVGTVIHTLLIEGTMEFYSKILLCGLVVLAFVLTLFQSRFQKP